MRDASGIGGGLRVNLIGRDNGSGLTHDVHLMKEFVEARGHQAIFVDWQTPPQEADVNIFLELFNPEHLDHAPLNVGVFNLEWFVPSWKTYLPRFTQLWAKSREAHRLYRGHGLPSYYTGFVSRDLRDAAVSKRYQVLHLRGAARQKNTAAVLEAWRRHHARLPPLVIVSEKPVQPTPGVRALVGRQSDDLIRTMMNEYRWHLCPSLIEGWGHAIAEALSCEAVAITTDASPMNEHVRPDFGVLIGGKRIPFGFTKAYAVDPDAIADAVTSAAALDIETLAVMGRRARAHWEERQTSFMTVASELFCRIEKVEFRAPCAAQAINSHRSGTFGGSQPV